jgi:hypothetical protein
LVTGTIFLGTIFLTAFAGASAVFTGAALAADFTGGLAGAFAATLGVGLADFLATTLGACGAAFLGVALDAVFGATLGAAFTGGFSAGFLAAGLADFAVGMVQTQNNRSTQSHKAPKCCICAQRSSRYQEKFADK